MGRVEIEKAIDSLVADQGALDESLPFPSKGGDGSQPPRLRSTQDPDQLDADDVIDRYFDQIEDQRNWIGTLARDLGYYSVGEFFADNEGLRDMISQFIHRYAQYNEEWIENLRDALDPDYDDD